jgi:putative hemolysin
MQEAPHVSRNSSRSALRFEAAPPTIAQHSATVEPAPQKLLSLDRLLELYRAAESWESFLTLAGIRYRIDADDLKHIPVTGPLLAVANHPFGLPEAIILTVALPKVRPDVRVVANSMLACVPELRGRCIFVENFGKRNSVDVNASALRQCARWLRNGRALLTFPADEVAHMNFRDGGIIGAAWNPAVARLAQIARAAVLPIFVKGSNSAAFQFAGAIRPGLRTANLPREFLNKRGRLIDIRIGRPVSAETLRLFPDAADAVEYLRCRTYLLENLQEVKSDTFRPPKRAVAAEKSRSQWAAEIARLGPESKLCGSGELAAYVGSERELPAVVREIGRLREIAFRRAGEGSGRDIDLDRFDRYYDHLTLWNRETQEIVDAYRLAPSADVIAQRGVGGLYTSTLFRYGKQLMDRIGPAVELGRSFIRPEYQKQYAPLLLLWKGIACYVARRPECATLFGAVSISDDYHPVSKHLLLKFLEAYRAEALAAMVAPRRTYRPDERFLRRTGLVRRVPAALDELSTLIADLERDGKGVPILIKQYLKCGGRLVGFNVDLKFSNAMDALIMVNLRTAPAVLLERYMGKIGAAEFRAYHAAKG